MRVKHALLVCAVLIIGVPGSSGARDKYADRVVDYWVGQDGRGDPQDVLGREDGDGYPDGVFEMGTDGWIIVEFTDYLAYDGPSYDLRVYSWCEAWDSASVYLSSDGEQWQFLGTAGPYQEPFFEFTPFDFGDDVGLVRFVKVVDDALSQGHRGFRLDAIEVLNGRLIPEPAFAPFLAVPLVAPVFARVGRGRKRRYGA